MQVDSSRSDRRRRLFGCYTTIPTMFSDDDDLSLDVNAMERHVQFLLEGGFNADNCTLLVGGAAGDFTTMSLDERVRAAEAVVAASAGRVPVVMGAQTTSTKELIQLVQHAERIGAEFVQISPPFYFPHTPNDFFEYLRAGAEAGDVGIVVYNTYWTSYGLTLDMIGRIGEIENVAGLKWTSGDRGWMTFERAVEQYADDDEVGR